MTKIAMCDDDDLVIQHYQSIFKTLSDTYPLDAYYYHSAEALLQDQETVASLDILYLDNYMEGMNGMQTARVIRAFNMQVQIIFLSSSSEFVFDSFDVQASNYLLKNNLSDDEFISKFKHTYHQISKYRGGQTYICKEYSSQTVLNIDDIIAVEVVSRKTHIYTKYGNFCCYDSIKSIQEQFKSNAFYLINRSCLIHMKYVKKIDKTEVYMENKMLFQIAIKKSSDFRLCFSKYLVSLS